MLRSFTVILLSFFLTLSILAPSVVSLTNGQYQIVLEDFSEDEKDDSEEKEVEEIDNEEGEDEKKEPFFLTLNKSSYLNLDNSLVSIIFIEGISKYSLEIQLPPPEYYI